VSHIQKIGDAGDATGDEGYIKVSFIKDTFVYSSSPVASPASPISWICDTAGHIE
jgi:hypothetical protein